MTIKKEINKHLNRVEKIESAIKDPAKRIDSKSYSTQKEGKLRKMPPANVVEVETFINPFVDKTQHLKG